jgi:hypothetical protein
VLPLTCPRSIFPGAVDGRLCEAFWAMRLEVSYGCGCGFTDSLLQAELQRATPYRLGVLRSGFQRAGTAGYWSCRRHPSGSEWDVTIAVQACTRRQIGLRTPRTKGGYMGGASFAEGANRSEFDRRCPQEAHGPVAGAIRGSSEHHRLGFELGRTITRSHPHYIRAHHATCYSSALRRMSAWLHPAVMTATLGSSEGHRSNW